MANSDLIIICVMESVVTKLVKIDNGYTIFYVEGRLS
jgi:hypothetical protein